MIVFAATPTQQPNEGFAMRMMLVSGEDRWKHFGTIERPTEELGTKELKEHEQAVTLYRETYREQEARHIARFGKGTA